MSERGSISLFVVMLAGALFALGGLVADGGAGLAAARRANDLAEGAARAGAAASTVPRSSGFAVIDPVLARQGALAYLASEGVEGDARVTPTSVVVTLAMQQPTRLLRLVGIDHLNVEGQGEARPVLGITGQDEEAG